MTGKRSKDPSKPKGKNGGARPGAGRHTYLTPAVHQQLVERIRTTAWVGVAARSLGLRSRTVWEWIHRGRKQPDVEPFGSFARDVDQAYAQSETDMIERLLACARLGDFQAVKFFLQKRWPKRWGDKAFKLEASGPDGKPITVKVDPDELLAKLLGGATDGTGNGGGSDGGGSSPPNAPEG